ncbi:MAG: right-handed parallel beta-helix repeat-containing protein [Kiritimatiellae bacterium]|nr:right-handed parallel beta-helix repeat-containing protein [Kiritimatiellia bacterium]
MNRYGCRTIIALLTASFACTGWCAVYCVSPLGDDGNPGTEAKPWRTIAKANATLRAGDTVQLRAGTYREPIAPANSGLSAEARITYAAYPGEAPLIDMGTPLKGWSKVPRGDPALNYLPDYRAQDGVDAIYRVASEPWHEIAEDDFATNGRTTIWWNKTYGSRALGFQTPDSKNKAGGRFPEYKQIRFPGEFYEKDGILYARTTHSDNPDRHRVRGLGEFAVRLEGRSHVAIRGLHVVNGNFLGCGGGSCITVEDCIFQYSKAWAGISIGKNVEHVTIRNCKIEGAGSFNRHRGSCIWIADARGHILVEGCDISWGGHDGLVISGSTSHVIVRNNTFHHLGGRFMGARGRGYCLVDGNRYTGSLTADKLTRQHAADHPPLTIVGGPCHIVRRNLVWGNAVGIGMQAGSYDRGDASHNSVYGNVVYGNSGTKWTGAGLTFLATDGHECRSNVVVNNILYDNTNAILGPVQLCLADKAAQPGAVRGANVLANNVLGSSAAADAQVVAVSKTRYALPEFAAKYPGVLQQSVSADPAVVRYDVDKPDFRLKPGSPCIDAGRFLTVATSAGTGTTLPVRSAWMFCDGWGMTEGDRVQLEGQTETAVVVRVDYAEAVLTLDRPLSWREGQGVGLPYSGRAPDIGAFEFAARPMAQASAETAGVPR